MMSMKLPNREKAYIPSAKLGCYLLSETHPVGRFKAKVLFAAGFDTSDVELLEQALLDIADKQELIDIIPFQYGTKYVISGDICSPTGSIIPMVTVWTIDIGHDSPRLVTAYPL